MTYTIHTPTTGASLGSTNPIYSWADTTVNRANLMLYLNEIYELAPQCNIPAHVIIAQSALETGNWTSLAWSVGNPAGIGVTNDAERTKYKFRDGVHSARTHLVHFFLYTQGKALPPALKDYISLDYRWTAAINAGYAGIAPTINGLTNTWAKDPAYADKIAKKLNDFELANLLTPPDRYEEGRQDGIRETLDKVQQIIDSMRTL